MEENSLAQKAFTIALETREYAHVPYSHFKVGACIKWQHAPDMHGGCNIENASYGLAICAERSAIARAIATNGKGILDFVLVVTDQCPPSVPCAACLQVMAEFAQPDTVIYLANLTGIEEKLLFSELLPRPFLSFST